MVICKQALALSFVCRKLSVMIDYANATSAEQLDSSKPGQSISHSMRLLYATNHELARLNYVLCIPKDQYREQPVPIGRQQTR